MARAKNRSGNSPSTSAAHNPVLKSGIVTSEELEVAPENTVSFDGGVRTETVSHIEVQSNIKDFKETADILAFFEEPVTIIISEATEKDAERYVFLSVNGVGAGPQNTKWVPRGIEVTVRRKYLNVLAGARPVKFKSVEFITNEGIRHSEQRASSADVYPFQVVEDANPRGREWLKQLRATLRAG